MSSILDKAIAFTKSGEFKKRLSKIVDDAVAGRIVLEGNTSAHSPEEAAGKFISVLNMNIASSGLSGGAASAIPEPDYLPPIKIGDGKYMITVYFSGDASRPSLDESHYGGIDDIVLLFNNGVGHTMKQVHGEWHGKEAWSKTNITGSHFIENAISDFMGNYATDYGVTSIRADGVSR